MDFYALSSFIVLSIISSAITPATSISPPLILTPYLERNQTEEARKMSKVDPKLFLDTTSYSGFLTVDKEHNSNTFFWYFPVNGKPVNETPWILWLQGGPGASSLIGVFDEMGPFQYDVATSGIKLREWTWCKDYSMVFVDNPVGSGYSFTDSEEGYARNMTHYTSHLHLAVQQLISIFPELSLAPLYVAGESYAGQYVPALATEIVKYKSILPINLQGIILGDPVISRIYQYNYTEVFYQWGLVDTQGDIATKDLQDSYTKAVISGNATKAYELHDKLLDKLQLISAQLQTYNVLEDNYEHLNDFTNFLSKEDVIEALHVGDTKFIILNNTVSQKLSGDFLSSTDEQIQGLLEHCRVLIYCGQLDLTVPCVSGAAARRAWHWARVGEFLQAPRTPWSDDNDTLTGYGKSGGGLTEVLIHGAGHLVPIDKPKQAWKLISLFIRGIDLPLLSNYQIPEYTQIPKQKETSEIARNGSTSDKSKDTSSISKPSADQDTIVLNSGVVVSIILNIILVLVLVGGVILYIRMRRKYEAFYYSTVDNLSDDIFLS